MLCKVTIIVGGHSEKAGELVGAGLFDGDDQPHDDFSVMVSSGCRSKRALCRAIDQYEKPSRLQARPTVTHVVADSQLTGQPALRKVQTLSTWSGDLKARSRSRGAKCMWPVWSKLRQTSR